MILELYEKTIIGSREEQQDFCLSSIGLNTAFAVVCDGMGGTNGGAAASHTATEYMMALYQTKNPNESYSDFFLRSVDVLDESVVTIQKNPGYEKSGTTVVAAAIDGNKLYWLSVGDSRLYIIRGGEIVQVTRDHNFALSLEQWDEDELKTAKAIYANQRADALISFIGMGGVRIYDINQTAFELYPDDMILLTSDGLTKALNDKEIHSILTSNQAEKSLEALFDKATFASNNSQDNTTCILIKTRAGEK